MKSQWQKCFTQLLLALVIEMILNYLGIDQIANYSEFVFNSASIKKEQIVKLQFSISSPTF